MPDTQTIVPAQELAATNKAHYPNESAEYRAARNKLLAEEIELRRHLERVASQRRALPLGGEIPQDFQLASETGLIRFSNLFGDKQTLLVYSMMYGPQRKSPCPSLHIVPDRLERDRCQSAPARCHRRHCSLAHRASDRIQESTRLHESAVPLRFVRRVHAHLRESRRCRCPRLQRLHPARWKHPSLLQRRDERNNGRSGTRSARRSGPRSSMANVGLDTGRSRHRLVSEARLRAQITPSVLPRRQAIRCLGGVTPWRRSDASARILRCSITHMNVILFGATGMVGQGVLRECLLDPDVQQILSIVRAPSSPATRQTPRTQSTPTSSTTPPSNRNSPATTPASSRSASPPPAWTKQNTSTSPTTSPSPPPQRWQNSTPA